MHSLVSYDWLSEYVALKGVTPEEFARRMSLSGPAVEKIIPQGEELEKIVVGQIKAIEKHPNADKMKIAVVDVGRKSAQCSVLSARSEKKHSELGTRHSALLRIVCGGTNLHEDQLVAVALPGARVRWHGQGDLITLEPTEIRGVKSSGMICGADEIGLGAAFPHAQGEILDLGTVLSTQYSVRSNNNLKPGTRLADLLGLSGDVVMDVEVTSNRVDAMGMIGMAREAAAILNKKFLWKPKSNKKFPISNFKFPIKVSAKKLCPRYMAARIDGVKVGPSPWWLKSRLLSAGLNSINNVVDITNFILLELAQPMHAFDAAKLEGGIDVRLARRGEKIQALDGKEYELDDASLVIADSKKPVAIAGITGGEKTGVTEGTTSIILEAATFDSVSVRRTSRRLNIQSDSQLRFEKGLSSEAPPLALTRAVELVLELAGGKLVAKPSDARTEKYKSAVANITAEEVNSLMGVKLPQKIMVDILRRLGFAVSTKGKTIKATVPWWRDHDIESGRDLVEEIARVYGYGNIPSVIPFGLETRPLALILFWEDRLREISKGAGCVENFSYSFVSKELLSKAGYDSTGMLHVLNPLTEDLAIMRTTLLPSLLQSAAENREREPVLRLFEIANVYYPKMTDDRRQKTDLPDERSELGALFMGMDDSWKVAKGYVEHLLSEMGIEKVNWRRLANDAFWHPGRTAQAFVEGGLVATVGEVSPKISANFKLDCRVAMVDMPLASVVRHAVLKKRYVPVPQFPSAKRDLAVVVDSHVEFEDMAQAITKSDKLIKTVEWFDTYIGKNLPNGKKSVAVHLEFSSPEKTLESKEVDAAMENALLALKEKFKAEVR